MRKINFLSWILLLLLAYPVTAQLSGSNLLEYQLGNLPDTDPQNLSTLYDQLNLTYRFENLILKTKIEQFQTEDDNKKYSELAQRSIIFRHGDFKLAVGNFYHIIGRGLLLRSYEIPGTILEDVGFRSRYGFYRDLDGFFIGYDPGFAEITAFRGKPLNNAIPPIISDDFRRPNLLEGINGTFYFDNWSAGGAYMRNNIDGEVREYFSTNLSVNLPIDIQLYSEYAQQSGAGNDLFDLSNVSAHALYLSLNFLAGPFGMSAEYKDYNEFLLGFNDPPPLVKEQQYLLLNRLTHRLIPSNESGWQTEFFYTLDEGHSMIVNIAEAVNETQLFRNIFKEQFAELSYIMNSTTSLKGFIDHSKETNPVTEDRYTAGAYAETGITSRIGLNVDVEYQTVTRTAFEKDEFTNYALLVVVSYAPDLSLGIVAEHSDDQREVSAGESNETWLSGSLSYQYKQHHLITLFYGKRRGGNACTSGICYEVLPFEGFEIRISSLL